MHGIFLIDDRVYPYTDARELDYISYFLRVYGTFIQTN